MLAAINYHKLPYFIIAILPKLLYFDKIWQFIAFIAMAIWQFIAVMAIWQFIAVLAIWRFIAVIEIKQIKAVMAIWQFIAVMAIWQFMEIYDSQHRSFFKVDYKNRLSLLFNLS